MMQRHALTPLHANIPTAVWLLLTIFGVLTSVQRTGAQLPLATLKPKGDLRFVVLSPDGKTLAHDEKDGVEEVPVSDSPLPGLFATGMLADAELAVVLEPTDNELHAGCLGNLQARVTFHGESAHSARPWTGVNAIHELARGLQALASQEPHDVEIDGLVFREVVSAVRVEGGVAANVIP